MCFAREINKCLCFVKFADDGRFDGTGKIHISVGHQGGHLGSGAVAFPRGFSGQL
jgi:hypothetical protein